MQAEQRGRRRREESWLRKAIRNMNKVPTKPIGLVMGITVSLSLAVTLSGLVFNFNKTLLSSNLGILIGGAGIIGIPILAILTGFLANKLFSKLFENFSKEQNKKIGIITTLVSFFGFFASMIAAITMAPTVPSERFLLFFAFNLAISLTGCVIARCCYSQQRTSASLAQEGTHLTSGISAMNLGALPPPMEHNFGLGPAPSTTVQTSSCVPLREGDGSVGVPAEPTP